MYSFLAVCNSFVLQHNSVDGAVEFTSRQSERLEVCCFEILDPNSYSDTYGDVSGPLLPALSGDTQRFTCSIQHQETADASVTVKVGDGSCCSVRGVTPLYNLHKETDDSNTCTNELRTCQTQVILQTVYDNHTDETRFLDASTDVYFHNFTRIDLHYQTCGDDVLTFSLPISSNVPLNVTCSEVDENNPARSVDAECEHLYRDVMTTEAACTSQTAADDTDDEADPTGAASEDDDDGGGFKACESV